MDCNITIFPRKNTQTTHVRLLHTSLGYNRVFGTLGGLDIVLMFRTISVVLQKGFGPPTIESRRHAEQTLFEMGDESTWIMTAPWQRNWPILQFPRRTCKISHNAPFCNGNINVCTFKLQNGALCYACLMHCMICIHQCSIYKTK